MGETGTLSDETLARRSLHGDREAFGVLAERHAQMVASIVRAELVDPEDTADLVQDAFLRAFSRLGELRSLDRFAPWIARIAASCARNWNARSRLDALTPRGPAFSDRVTRPRDELLDQRELLDRGLRVLPHSLRAPLLMRHGSNASYAEIAAVLLITPEAAEIRVRRGLAALRKFYRRTGLESDCRATLRSLALTPLALGELWTAVRRRISMEPDPPTQVDQRTTLWALPSGILGAVAGALIFGFLVHPSAVDVFPVTPATTQEIGVSAAREMLRRPMVLTRSRDRDSTRRVLIAPDRQLDGWLPIQPANDASVPQAASGQIDGRPSAGVAGNDFGVYKPFEPQSGTVGLSVWLRPSATATNATFGLVFADPVRWRTSLIRKNETNQWFHAVDGDEKAFGRVDGEGHKVRVRYRVADATYSLWLDGEPVVMDTPAPSTYVGQVPQGVYIVSGRDGDPAPLYFDNLSVWAEDADAEHPPAGGRRKAVAVSAAPMSRIALLSGALNGRQLDPSLPTVVVGPRERIQGTVQIEVDNTHSEGSVFPVVMTQSWGDRQGGYRSVAADAPSGVSVHVAVVRLVAPDTPGPYWITFVGAAEKTAAHVAAGTGWAGGAPVWGNETDVAGWPTSLVERGLGDGYVRAPWLDHGGLVVHVPVAATVIRVIVTALESAPTP